MKEKLIELVTEKAGIDVGQAEAAVDAVLGFMKENPADVKGLLSDDAASPDIRERIGDAREKIAPVAEKGKEALGEARERLAPVAAQAGEKIGEVGGKVAGRLKGFLKRGDDDEEAEAPAEAAETEENTTPAST
ncbi:MAG: hypothetical protein AB7T37_08180 [Dehalococcoidia bacterium]